MKNFAMLFFLSAAYIVPGFAFAKADKTTAELKVPAERVGKDQYAIVPEGTDVIRGCPAVILLPKRDGFFLENLVSKDQMATGGTPNVVKTYCSYKETSVGGAYVNVDDFAKARVDSDK